MGQTHYRTPLTDHLLDRPLSGGLGAFAEGMRLPWEGYLYLRANRDLWRFGVLPLLLSGLFTSAAFAGLGWVGWWLYAKAAVWVGAAWWAGVVKVLLAIGVGVLVVGAGVGMALVTNVILCSFFYVRLTREVEIRLGVHDGELHDVAFFRDLADNLVALIEIVLANAAAFVLGFVPVVGPAVGWYLNAFLLGAEFLEYPWVVRGRARSERRAVARSHRVHVLGLGTVVIAFNLVPFLGGAALTTAVTGSVFWRRRLLASR